MNKLPSLILAILAGHACCFAQENQKMKSPAVDAGIEDLQVGGREIQRLWWENDKLLFALSGAGVVDVYAKTDPRRIGREVFTGATDEARAPKHPNLIALTPQGETCGAAAWVCSVDAANRKKLLRPWGYNSFTNDARRAGYGARTAFQARRPREGKIYCDAVLANIKTRAGPVHAFLAFDTRPGENFIRMRLGSPDRLYRRRGSDPQAEKFKNFRIGIGMAKLPGEKAVRRGDNYIAIFADNPSGEATKVALALVYDKTNYKGYIETTQDGGNRAVYFAYEPRKNFSIRMWLVVGSDIDGSASSATQWEKYVKGLAGKFQAALPTP